MVDQWIKAFETLLVISPSSVYIQAPPVALGTRKVEDRRAAFQSGARDIPAALEGSSIMPPFDVWRSSAQRSFHPRPPRPNARRRSQKYANARQGSGRTSAAAKD